jgi:hypothetical protein
MQHVEVDRILAQYVRVDPFRFGEPACAMQGDCVLAERFECQDHLWQHCRAPRGAARTR